VPWPALGQIGRAPWWAWLGGAAGAFYGVAAIMLANSLGAATLMALAASGQLLASVAFDHFGWLGFAVHPAGWARIAGCLFMIGGFVLIARYLRQRTQRIALAREGQQQWGGTRIEGSPHRLLKTAVPLVKSELLFVHGVNHPPLSCLLGVEGRSRRFLAMSR